MGHIGSLVEKVRNKEKGGKDKKGIRQEAN